MNKITINNFVPSKIIKIDDKCIHCNFRFQIQIEDVDSVLTMSTDDSKREVECVCPYCGSTCFVKFDC